MSGKALQPAELELTQRIQLLFPRGLPPEILRAWNGAPGHTISNRLLEAFGNGPSGWNPPLELLVDLPRIVIPALDEFDVQRHIRLNIGDQAPVQITCVDSDFKDQFYGLVEPARPQSELYPRRITSPAPYHPVIREGLGGDRIIRATLGQIHWLTLQQSRGQAGILLEGGQANLFEVLNLRRVPTLLNILWLERGWAWFSHPVEDPEDWEADRLVFSGNPRPQVVVT